MTEPDIDLDFGDTAHQDPGSDGEVEDLEDGEVKDDDDEDEEPTPPPAPFRPKNDLEPGEAPLTPGEVQLARASRAQPHYDPHPPPPFDPYEPALLPTPPLPGPPRPPGQPGPAYIMDQWGCDGPPPPPMMSQQILCKFYARGDCAYGDSCRFAHPPGFIPRPPPPVYGFRGGPPRHGPPMRGGLMSPRGRALQGPPVRFFPRPGPPAQGEDSWEAGLQRAKELLKKSGKLKGERESNGDGAPPTQPHKEEPISEESEGSEWANARMKTPPTPDPETYYGGRQRNERHRSDGRLGTPERPPVPLSYRPGREEYETYHPPPRSDRSPPLSPSRSFSPRASRSQSQYGYEPDPYDQPVSRKRELPPPPKERNHAHPPPKIFKGTSKGPLQRRDDDVEPRHSRSSREGGSRSSREPTSRESRSRESRSRERDRSRDRDRDSAERRSRERELRKESARQLLEQRRGSKRDRGDRALPYSRSSETPPLAKEEPVRPSASDSGWVDPWERRSRRSGHSSSGRRRRRSSESSDSSRSSSKHHRKSARSNSLDSVSSVESYDSQKHGRSHRTSPVIDQKNPTVKNPTGKLADLLQASESKRKTGGSVKSVVMEKAVVKEDVKEEAVSDASSSDSETKTKRREQLLQQLKAVEDQVTAVGEDGRVGEVGGDGEGGSEGGCEGGGRVRCLLIRQRDEDEAAGAAPSAA